MHFPSNHQPLISSWKQENTHGLVEVQQGRDYDQQMYQRTD